jgi:hypothetical protein
MLHGIVHKTLEHYFNKIFTNLISGTAQNELGMCNCTLNQQKK